MSKQQRCHVEEARGHFFSYSISFSFLSNKTIPIFHRSTTNRFYASIHISNSGQRCTFLGCLPYRVWATATAMWSLDTQCMQSFLHLL